MVCQAAFAWGRMDYHSSVLLSQALAVRLKNPVIPLCPVTYHVFLESYSTHRIGQLSQSF